MKNQVEPGPDRALASAHRVVIVGGGFAGLYAAKRLGKAPLALTLIDRRNFHLFQPLLYQVATGGLSPGEIASPLRVVLRGHRNTEVLLAEVVDFDIANRRVILADGERPYDDLVISTGATHFYFGHDEWEPLAPGLKTVEDATEIRRRILLAYEEAEREPDPAQRHAWLTFVIAGGEQTVEQMVASTERGILVTRLWYIREVDPYEKIFTGMTRDGTFLVEGGKVTAGVRNFRFNQGLMEMLSNVEALSPAVRASGEETFDMVAPAMQVRDFNFTEVTRF